MRQLILLVALMVCIGCRSQSWNPLCGPGARVPPPPTGSYGQPNTYYQGSLQPIPNGLTRTGGGASSHEGRWSTVRDETSTSLTATSSDRPVGTGAKVDIDVALTQPRLNGMPVNRVRPIVEPAPFVPDASASELKSRTTQSDAVGSNVRVAGATDRDVSSSSRVSSANWQSRSNVSRTR